MSRIKRQFKLLRSIVPLASKKADFRHILESKVARESSALSSRSAFMRIAWSMRTAPALALAIIITLIGSGSGISFAAQNAIPGETLYPVKLATERARMTFTPNKKAKAELHLQFASRRLHEVERLISENRQPQINVSDVLKDYKNEFDESESLAIQDPKLAQDLAPIIGETTESHKHILAIIAKKAHEQFDGDFDNELTNAYEHAESKDDAVLYAALAATSTPPTAIPSIIKEKSRKKWESIEREMKKMEAVRSAPATPEHSTVTATGTDTTLITAQAIIDTAKTQWESGDYRHALDNSIEARALIKEAEHTREKERTERDYEENRREKDN